MVLRDLIEQPKLLLAIGAWDALTASLANQAGAEAIYLSGSCVASSVTADPDVGLITMTEMVRRARQTSRVIDIPLIADADTGYGNEISVRRTVDEYERAGVDAIQIEDQLFPKKCGHFEGKQLIPAPDFAVKVEAAVDVRESDSFLVIARTDAIATDGIEEAIRRAKLYKRAGADVLFIEAPTQREEMERITEEVPGPLLVNMAAKGKTPQMSAESLEQIGYDMAIYPTDAFMSALKTIRETYETLIETGSQERIVDGMVEWETRNRITKLGDIMALEDHYSESVDRYAEIYDTL